MSSEAVACRKFALAQLIEKRHSFTDSHIVVADSLVRREEKECLVRFAPEARAILDDLLGNHAEHSTGSFHPRSVEVTSPVVTLSLQGMAVEWFSRPARSSCVG